MERLREGLKKYYAIGLIIALPAILFTFTLDRYYGYYYDNKFFNLLTLEIWEEFRLYLYLGSHYHVPSSLYSYIALPFFYIFGPGDLAMEAPAAFFHLLTVFTCWKLGKRFFGEAFAVVFALFVALAPIHLVQVYTLPDLSFAIFLNVLSIHLFFSGLQDSSRARVILSSIAYSIGCFQAIYSLLLLPFFVACAVVYALQRSQASGQGQTRRSETWERTASVFFFILAIPAYTYLYLLFKSTYLAGGKGAVALVATAAAVFAVYARKGLLKPHALTVALLFPMITLALLSYFDLIVQIDYLVYGHKLGYYLDASPAGGYGGRPLARFLGKEVSIYGYPIYMSVLTSMFEFVGKDFAKMSFGADGLYNLYFGYFLKSFPASVRWLFYAGVVWHGAEIIKNFRKRELSVFNSFPAIWLVVALQPFFDLGPDYFNIRRIYILPLPYLFASFGVVGLHKALAFFTRAESRKALLLIALLAALDQTHFSVKNIFWKFENDRSGEMYFKLFYGHYYGRSYKEAGEYLLMTAPRKKDGHYRAAVVYTIPEDSKIGRSLPLFNTINWYTQNQFKIIFDFKKKSAVLYGTKESLSNYLECFFDSNPYLEAVYFADFVDDENNYAFFSKIHPYLKPEAVVKDDHDLRNDCKLFRFDRDDWRLKIGEIL